MSKQDIALHWIDRQWVDSARHRNSIDPATGDTIGVYADGGGTEAQAAIDDFIEYKHITLSMGAVA